MRVPVSIVVKMNKASNMMAKWYQYLITDSIEIPEPHGGRLRHDLRHSNRQGYGPTVRPRRLSPPTCCSITLKWSTSAPISTNRSAYLPMSSILILIAQ